jgi:hypothetical protein
MRGDDDRASAFRIVEKVTLDLKSGCRVKRCGWFIQKQHLRIQNEGAYQRETLALAVESLETTPSN